jgi:hypothetical protein
VVISKKVPTMEGCKQWKSKDKVVEIAKFVVSQEIKMHGALLAMETSESQPWADHVNSGVLTLLKSGYKYFCKSQRILPAPQLHHMITSPL